MHKKPNDFDTWNSIKKKIDTKFPSLFTRPKEIWWCSLGLNIGTEINGKSPLYDRPVLILKVFNNETILVLPLTSKRKDDQFHYRIEVGGVKSWIKLTQIRVISVKRLRRKIMTISGTTFTSIRQKLFLLI